MNRFQAIVYTLKHKLAILYLWWTCNTQVSIRRVVLHDYDKVFMYLIFGKEFTSKFHKKHSRHHQYKNYEDFKESYLDYASARITKPDKPLNALETFKKVNPSYYDLAVEFNKVSHYY